MDGMSDRQKVVLLALVTITFILVAIFLFFPYVLN
jgi:hypothetical protein